MDNFRQLVEEKIRSKKFSTIVVDKYHAYGIIASILNRFNIEEEDGQELLIELAAFSEIISEQLGLASSTTDIESSKYKDILISIIRTIEEKKVITDSLQKGKPRFSFCFDQEEIEEIKGKIH